MPIAEEEALACLNVLVAMARADGKIDPAEKKSLAAAIASFDLPPSISADQLLAEKVDVDAELAKIGTSDAREQIYRSAWFLAHADGRSVPEERAILDRIAAVTNPSDALRAQLSNLAPAKGRSSAFVESLRGLFRARA
ncbi:DUF533 domain-containing protein [Labilithrix luteola]|uniref:tellurite resistance TerB family protein n=1 Tax=Labilithrix luteola TaxID=1391654 RepID=UPI0011BA6527